MDLIAQVALLLASLVVLAEACNKLEFCDPARSGLAPKARLLEVLKAVAWFLLALGAGGGIAAPAMRWFGMNTDSMQGVLRLDVPTLDHVVTMVGLAIVIVRTRIKEG